jgi:hypothetical protein
LQENNALRQARKDQTPGKAAKGAKEGEEKKEGAEEKKEGGEVKKEGEGEKKEGAEEKKEGAEEKKEGAEEKKEEVKKEGEEVKKEGEEVKKEGEEVKEGEGPSAMEVDGEKKEGEKDKQAEQQEAPPRITMRAEFCNLPTVMGLFAKTLYVQGLAPVSVVVVLFCQKCIVSSFCPCMQSLIICPTEVA